MLLVEDFLHGDELDDPPALLVERRALLLGVGGVAEGDEEAALAVSLEGPASPRLLSQLTM